MKFNNLAVILLALLAILFLLTAKKAVYNVVRDKSNTTHRNTNYDSQLINQPVDTNKTVVESYDTRDLPNGGFNDDLHDQTDTFEMNYKPSKEVEQKNVLGLSGLDKDFNGDDKYEAY